jgi:hypothetical protein
MNPPSPNDNRRASRRRRPKPSTRLACRCGAFGLGHDVPAVALDLSETGARLLLEEELFPGQEVELAFQSPNRPRPLKVAAEVVWCEPEPNGGFGAGVRFRRQMDYPALLGLTYYA